MSGALAGVANAIVLSPVEHIRIRLQVNFIENIKNKFLRFNQGKKNFTLDQSIVLKRFIVSTVFRASIKDCQQLFTENSSLLVI